MAADILLQKDSQIKILIIIFSTLFLYSCGGGGGTACLDTDTDGICNSADTDDDGDGILDSADAFPLDSTETLDTDSDGIGNNADTDDDGDGVSDTDDVASLNSALSAYMDWTTTGTNANKWGAACNGVACNGLSGLLSYNVSTGVANGDSGSIDTATAANGRGGMNFTVGVANDSFELRSSENGSGLGGSDVTDRRTPVLINDAENGNRSFTSSMQTAGPTPVTSSVTMGGNVYTYEYAGTYAYGGDVQDGTVSVQIITPTTHNEQLWIKWNSLSMTDPTDHYYNFAIVGKDVAFTALPSSGSATYTGGLDGYFKYDSNPVVGTLAGNSSFTANWATSKIAGTFSNIQLSLGESTTNFENISFTEMGLLNTDGMANFGGSGISSGADLDTEGHFLYGAFFDGNHTNGAAPASLGGNFRFEDAANTGYGAFFFAATKD